MAGTALVLGAGAGFTLWAGAPPSPVGVVQKYVAAQNAHDYATMEPLLAESIQVSLLFDSRDGPASTNRLSRMTLIASIKRAANRFPNIRFEIVSVMSEGRIVTTRELFTGGAEPGSQVGMTVYRVTEGRIDYIGVIPPQ